MTAKNFYAYTLQPVNYEVSETEQRHAQMVIWRSTNKIGMKAWLIMAAILVLSILGLILLKNYSTVFCWVAIGCVIAYYLARTYGLEWYVKRKMKEYPVQEIKGIRLGVQPHGIVMRQQMGAQEGVGTIAWKDIYEWYNTPEFILLNFKVKGQQGAYILPKRMDSKNFSFKTIRQHLTESVGEAKSI
ncbi:MULTISPECIES: YcxB family protein [unclassified Acinetobacter]|uniref:YcxB family protein n=1 Tax=unclassified Acinetobacter TaxID=196816 RepID=UPI002934BF14|nr:MULTISPECIES: YcxB family protein [unclassified Acinetobacter]WOE32848.1 YcxB family protein [Acinetobacter sp. SAAs470]WOE38325.1 YcxB family protein [Acinetobacter sp. SAAs474]